jgi:hypothetical protein
MTDKELLQQALDSLEWAERRYSYANLDLFNKPIEALRTRLAQPEPEPILWIKAKELGYMLGVKQNGGKNWKSNLGLVPEEGDVPLYLNKEWVGLTDKEIEDLWGEPVNCMYSGHYNAILAIEAKLKEKNA